MEPAGDGKPRKKRPRAPLQELAVSDVPPPPESGYTLKLGEVSLTHDSAFVTTFTDQRRALKPGCWIWVDGFELQLADEPTEHSATRFELEHAYQGSSSQLSTLYAQRPKRRSSLIPAPQAHVPRIPSSIDAAELEEIAAAADQTPLPAVARTVSKRRPAAPPPLVPAVQQSAEIISAEAARVAALEAGQLRAKARVQQRVRAQAAAAAAAAAADAAAQSTAAQVQAELQRLAAARDGAAARALAGAQRKAQSEYDEKQRAAEEALQRHRAMDEKVTAICMRATFLAFIL
jgi:hypothetical protein